MEQLNEYFSLLDQAHVPAIANIRGRVLRSLQNHLLDKGFKQLMPVLMSPITDPLNHAVYPAVIEYEGRSLKLTASMIFHKQLALCANGHEKIFIVAPNIRLEKPEIKHSGNHLLEFSQFDFEIRNATLQDAMATVEDFVKHAIREVRLHCKDELSLLGRTLPDYDASFPVYRSEDLHAEHGDHFEKVMSERMTTPFFVTNYKREFYDRENPSCPGTYHNYDLIYPEGFGEGLSGAERECDYDVIVRRMKEQSMDPAPYANYLAVAKAGLLSRSAGGGLGIERFVKFLSGKRHIRDVSLFDRSVATSFLF